MHHPIWYPKKAIMYSQPLHEHHIQAQMGLSCNSAMNLLCHGEKGLV